jgi:hypothetical protein
VSLSTGKRVELELELFLERIVQPDRFRQR